MIGSRAIDSSTIFSHTVQTLSMDRHSSVRYIMTRNEKELRIKNMTTVCSDVQQRVRKVNSISVEHTFHFHNNVLYNSILTKSMRWITMDSSSNSSSSNNDASTSSMVVILPCCFAFAVILFFTLYDFQFYSLSSFTTNCSTNDDDDNKNKQNQTIVVIPIAPNAIPILGHALWYQRDPVGN
jgi:hypothetical protein